jgi:early secretory antigenic target protein ESAT-6
VTHFQTDIDALSTASGSIHASADRIRAEVAGMLGLLTGLDSSWTGQASAAFQGVVGLWRTTQGQVDDGLESIALALGTAGQQYAETEEANARLFAF